MVLKELNDLRVLVKLEGAGAVLQTCLASSKMLLKVTPMTCGPVSLLWSVSAPSLSLSSGHLPHIRPPLARLFHGLSCPALKVPWGGWACLPLALTWCASSILPRTLASGQQLQLLISALILSSMRFQPPAYAKTALSPLPLCPILSVCPIPSYFSNNIPQTLCRLVKVKLSLSQTGECAVTPVHCLLQCTLIKLFLHGY